jgi:hypothetical protein
MNNKVIENETIIKYKSIIQIKNLFFFLFFRNLREEIENLTKTQQQVR